MRCELPYARAGMKIGLLGGSFDPPHRGHVHISQAALKRFGLDEVWWLVTPGNPLKENGPAPIAKRMAAAHALVDHPRIKISDFESRMHTRYTAETLEALFKTYRGVRFTWLMGADNLAEFHRWDRWTWIMENIPVGVLARPGDRISARMSPAAKRYDFARLRGASRRLLPLAEPAAWCFVNLPMTSISSTELRAKTGWGS
ncbi:MULTISPECIES: nicotinate-nucleotide adenylyltransferase [Halocynthiibacter]|uniref:Probable nicotinate-nucleotide adenylyltransferase n=1 Tax=Halocynthiibacter halioticoli TaxID=2986804 RepID=A0AAE3IZ26_9RHOB|nr:MULTISPECIES: nicotinate-nucleotide adenylyltransferase [Halocynthiibacter]MCV6823566.1 nicotinate-nucleotide adenylyltransferase [Halocynthiibacter halioticoli]MCW4056567.1 nicotinate-nucleotide adenylyltransferase [Halocynthiibacter sp. SDUM655004]